MGNTNPFSDDPWGSSAAAGGSRGGGGFYDDDDDPLLSVDDIRQQQQQAIRRKSEKCVILFLVKNSFELKYLNILALNNGSGLTLHQLGAIDEIRQQQQ